ncbi:uncharacterized protein LOC106073014 [Biomphalaria glabrata]|uniref:Uncharacterized protein LOC106073014 n=1 Tax=Biomphalaria glabrata TaxID=6526 RepID=A0A9W2Z390_BIOGL|nr:uncharacterized protein LOC106073014 [Biomphalaria glabrata]
MTTLLKLKPKGSVILVAIGGTLLLIGVVLHIISMSTDYFAILKDADAKYVATNVTRRYTPDNLTGVDTELRFGLWRLCVGSASLSQKAQSQCYAISANGTDVILSPYWIQSAQVLSIVGVIVAGSGVISTIAWILNDLAKCVNLFLVVSVTCAVIGGILILSSDITFAAKYSIDIYHSHVNNIYFTTSASAVQQAFEIAALDFFLDVGWSFALDIAAGSLCVLSAVPMLLAAIVTSRKSPAASSSTKSKKSDLERLEFFRASEGDTRF